LTLGFLGVFIGPSRFFVTFLEWQYRTVQDHIFLYALAVKLSFCDKLLASTTDKISW